MDEVTMQRLEISTNRPLNLIIMIVCFVKIKCCQKIFKMCYLLLNYRGRWVRGGGAQS